MGCDGGSIVGRSELVKTKKTESTDGTHYFSEFIVHVSGSLIRSTSSGKHEANFSRWRSCTFSQEILAAPVVCDDLGNLFNKSALIEALIAKALPPMLSHIRGLRDVFAVTLRAKEAGEADDEMGSVFVCPVTLLPANGRNRCA
jgi:hypothetical protein